MLITKRQLLNTMTYNRDAKMAHSQVASNNNKLFESASVSTYDVFLSHSYSDRNIVIPLVELMQKCGYSVYVDWINDNELDRTHVDKATADLLRERVKQCRSLAFLTTVEATNSKWCPWELGYFDGFSENQRCCIIPVSDYEKTSFKGQEYLGLYNYIDIAQQASTDTDDLWVCDVNNSNKYVRLDLWLNGENPELHPN